MVLRLHGGGISDFGFRISDFKSAVPNSRRRRVDKFGGEPIEQVGIGGGAGVCVPKSLALATSPRPEMALPDAIDDYARRQRVGAVGGASGPARPAALTCAH